MTTLIFDTETTGLIEPEIVSAAWMMIDEFDGLKEIDKYEEFFKPSKPIELGALAVHNIMDEDLVNNAPSSSFRLPEGVRYIVGHNVDFDWKVVGMPDVRRICTLAMCRKLWPHADSHKQGAMAYAMFREDARDMLKMAHSAMADVRVCHRILEYIVKETGLTSWEALHDFSEHARVPDFMPFGKHKGVPVGDVPSGYRSWVLRQPDTDPYLALALDF